MADFEFPTNVKQIGSIGEGLRIYVEDYVCTYLFQYAESAGYEERIALLVGRSMVIDGQAVLFVSGAIQGLFSRQENGISILTDKTWQYADQMLHKYFSGLEIVGLMQSQPSYGVFLNANYAEYHMNNFKEKNEVLFVTDPIEKVNVFYRWNESHDNLVETGGYFIYYDKNRGMHEYMLENKIVKLKLQPAPEIEEHEEIELNLFKEKLHKRKPDVVFKKKEKENSKKNVFEHKRIVNMLVTSSAVLLLVVFIMGLGLIQNEGRITALEDQLKSVAGSYKELVTQIKEVNTASVFNPQNEDKNEIKQAELIEENGLETAQEISKIEPTATPAPPTKEPVEEEVKATPQPVTPEPTVAPVNTTNAMADISDIPETYIVQEGDNLGYISLKFYGTRNMMDKIMELNNMTDPDTLYFGKVIKLP